MHPKDELESAPSILELFLSAKKLLSLQPRVENRQLRKENIKTQRSHSDMNGMDNFDLLSPVSIDDLTSYKPSAIQAAIASKKNGGKSLMGSYVTPSSINDDSPPGSGSSTNSRNNSDTPNTTISWGSLSHMNPTTTTSMVNHDQPMDYETNNIAAANTAANSTSTSTSTSTLNSNSTFNESHNVRIKNEPTTTISPIQIHSENKVKTTVTAKSNLTSSIHQQEQQRLNGFEQNIGSRPLLVPPSISTPTPTPPSTSGSVASSSSPTECSNCHTLKTPLWRKDPVGNTLCNACGLFQKLHGTTRPLSLKTDVIKKRNSRRLPNSTKLSSSVGTSTPSANISRNNSIHDLAVSYNGRPSQPSYSGGIPINSGGGNSFTNNHNNNIAIGSNTPTSSYTNNASFLLNSGGISINNSGSRYKNVLILPKPPGGGGGGNTVAPSRMNSIPIPNGNHIQDGPLSVSPFTSNAGTPTPISGSMETSQLFKRKKGEMMENEGGVPISNSQRNSSQVSLSGQWGGKRGSLSSSFQSSSLNRRTSVTNLSSFQRKNSILGVNNMGTPPTNALTPTNIGLLNQRFAAQTGSYFDSKGNGFAYANTPGSEFGNLTSNGDEIYSLPDSSNEVKGEDIDTEDFFKNYTSLQNEDNEGTNGGFVAPATKFEIPVSNTQPVSSLTTLMGGKNQDQGQDREDMKDLDWLKFEI